MLQPLSAWRGRWAALGGGLVTALLMAELLLRLLDLDVRWLGTIVPRQKADVGAHRRSADPELLYELIPGHRDGLADLGSERNSWSLQVNQWGHRGPDRPLEKPEGVRRILTLGSSNTFGATVSQGEGWPEQLEVALRTRGKAVEVWNLGVSGYVTRQVVANGRAWAKRSQADLILIQLYNVGTRLVLSGEDLGDLVQQDPSLWCEQLSYAPCPGEPGWTLFAHSGLVRTAITGWNRHFMSRDREGFVARVTSRADNADRERLRSFVREVAPTPVVLIVTPAGFSSGWLDGLGLPLYDLRELGQPFGEAGERIHPSVAVYNWYGEVLATRILADAWALP